MNKPKKIFFVFFGILGLITITLIALVLFFEQGSTRIKPDPVYSADGSKVIIPIINSNKADSTSYLLIYLEIKDIQSEKTLFQVQTRASNRMRWSVEWLDNNTVLLDSSDIGSYCWKEGSDRIWIETKCPK